MRLFGDPYDDDDLYADLRADLATLHKRVLDAETQAATFAVALLKILGSMLYA